MSLNVRAFTYSEAYGRTLVVAVTGIVVIESTVLHVWIGTRHPLLAWLLTITSLVTLVWLWRDDSRFRDGRLYVDENSVRIAMGSRWRGEVSRTSIVSVVRPSWQDLPTSGSASANDYVNLTKPADPNVLITLHQHAALRVFGIATKNVRRIGCHLDAPDEFIQLLAASVHH